MEDTTEKKIQSMAANTKRDIESSVNELRQTNSVDKVEGAVNIFNIQCENLKIEVCKNIDNMQKTASDDKPTRSNYNSDHEYDIAKDQFVTKLTKVGGLINQVSKALSELFTFLSNSVNKLWETIKSSLESAVTAVTNFGIEVVATVENAFKNLSL